MPNFSATPGAIAIAGGTATFVPARFSASAAVLNILGGSAGFTVGTVANDSVTTPTLNRLTRFDQLTQGDAVSTRFQTIWQRTMEAIEAAFEDQQGQITDLSNIIARLEATEAQAAAAQAQAAATASTDALAKSYPSPSTILTAASDGTVSITAHTRVYGDGTSVAVNGGSVTGFASGAFVQVYYDDAGRAGGAVAYQGTLDVIAQTGARHIVGGVAIPLAGEAPYDGFPPFPPGYVPDYRETGI